MTSDFRVFVTDPPVRHTPDKCVVFNRTALLLLFFLGGFFCSAEELQARLFESFKKKKKKRKKCHTSRGDRGLFCLHLFALYSAAFVQWRLYFCTQYYLFFRLLLHSRTHTVSFRLKQIVACQVLTRGKKKKVMMEIIIKKEKKLFVVWRVVLVSCVRLTVGPPRHKTWWRNIKTMIILQLFVYIHSSCFIQELLQSTDWGS